MTALKEFWLATGEYLPAEKAIVRCEQLGATLTVDRTFWLALALKIQKEQAAKNEHKP